MIRIKRKPVHSRLSRFEDYVTGLLGLPRQWLNRWGRNLSDIPAARGTIAIAVIHNRRWIEWQVFSAFALRRMGYQPVLLYSGTELSQIMSRLPLAERFLKSFHPKSLRLPDARLLDLDTFLPAGETPAEDWSGQAMRLSHMLTAYTLKVEEFETTIRPEYERLQVENERMIRNYGHAADAVLRCANCDTLLCPNGRFGLSVPLRLAAERLGLRSVFVEGWGMRPGHMLLGINRPAMDWDIAGWLKELGPWSEKLERDFQDYMRFRAGKVVKRKGWLDSFHQTQRVGDDQRLPQGLVRFLNRPGRKIIYGSNCIGDSSTLGKATAFRSQKSLLEQLVPYMQSRSDLNLVIRVHPDEAVWFTNQSMEKIAQALSGNSPNILVVGPREAVNTHALMDACDIGLAWVSNFGLEMALKHKPVILCANAPYGQLGLCHAPATAVDFFAMLDKQAVRPQLPPTFSANENIGKSYLYILFNKMSIQAYGGAYRLADLDLEIPDPNRERYFDIVIGKRSPFE